MIQKLHLVLKCDKRFEIVKLNTNSLLQNKILFKNIEMCRKTENVFEYSQNYGTNQAKE